MNETTGEIREFTSDEVNKGIPKKLGFNIQLTPGEAELLEDLEDPKDRIAALKEWKDYKETYLKKKPFHLVVDIKYGFLTGYVAGKLKGN